jgi:hypothetical protein
VEIEDIGPKDFGMKFPDCVKASRVGLGIEPMDVFSVEGRKGDDPGLAEHADKFRAGAANERSANARFGLAEGFANEDDGHGITFKAGSSSLSRTSAVSKVASEVKTILPSVWTMIR